MEGQMKRKHTDEHAFYANEG